MYNCKNFLWRIERYNEQQERMEKGAASETATVETLQVWFLKYMQRYPTGMKLTLVYGNNKQSRSVCCEEP
jgi:hypothetical protein